MNSALTPALSKVLEGANYRPAVSIVLPFDPKMTAKEQLSAVLKTSCDQVEKSLLKQYPPELALLLLQRLKKMLRDLNYSTHKRSIALFVSPVFEKVLYLDMEVVPKIIVDDSFEIRHLIDCKKASRQFLVAILLSQEMHVLLGEPGKWKRILSRPIDTSKAGLLPFSEQTLGHLINVYKLPAFVLAAERHLTAFREACLHQPGIFDFIPFTSTERDFSVIESLVEPYLANWTDWQQTFVLRRLTEAGSAGLLSMGMSEVWKETMHHNGRFVVVERGFTFDGFQPHNPYSYIKDAVDEIIEKVLESGGEVAFVEEGKLADYGQIALLRYS